MPTLHWIPEAPQREGCSTAIYACDDDGRYTADAYRALRYATREECQRWCDDHPQPVYVPVCHDLG